MLFLNFLQQPGRASQLNLVQSASQFGLDSTKSKYFQDQSTQLKMTFFFIGKNQYIENNIYYVGHLLLQVYTSTKLHQQSHTALSCIQEFKSQEDSIIVLESRILSHNLKLAQYIFHCQPDNSNKEDPFSKENSL